MRLHAIERGPDARAPQESGPPVVLLHGLFGQAGNFAWVQRRLAPTRRVIALDLRNHGASPHAAGMTYATMAEDVLETLAALDALPCRLVGHSMGGKVAMALALERPEAVARLLVADIAPLAYPPRLRGHVAAMQAVRLEPGLTRAAADAVLRPAVPEAPVRGFLLQSLLPGAAPRWKLGLAEIAAAMPDIEGWQAPDGARYDGPVLFIAGGRSDFIRPRSRPAIRALFPHAKFVTLRHAGHWLHADDPEGFLAVVSTALG